MLLLVYFDSVKCIHKFLFVNDKVVNLLPCCFCFILILTSLIQLEFHEQFDKQLRAPLNETFSSLFGQSVNTKQ